MSDVVRVLREDDQLRDNAVLYGSNLYQIQEQTKDLANQLAMEGGEAVSGRDALRAGFVLSAAAIIAGDICV
jgi:hypothetical protein